jgi:hypothetical protein
MNRRVFLRLAGITAGTVAIGGSGLLLAREINRDPLETIQEIVARRLSERFGEVTGAELAGRIDREFALASSLLPDVGTPEENKWAVYLPPSALALAAYRVLVPARMDIDSFGRMFFEAVREQMNNPSSWAMQFIGTDEGMRENTRKLAERSQQRRYPEDWVIEFVEGDGANFTYGINVTECGILKYLTRQGAPELTRYLCLTDYATSEAIGRGLVRQQTLAEGCACCDFRYKKGRPSFVYPLRNGWPPQFAGDVEG